MILLIDNYDSFSYNLYQMVGELNPDIKVIKNNELSVDEIKSLHPEKIIISPGPGKPEESGVCIDVIKSLGKDIPILGVCLGHQAMCVAFGGTVSYAGSLMHGKTSDIKVSNSTTLFKGLDEKMTVARYHSLIAMNNDFPDELHITAKTDEGEIMALEHKTYPIFGVQFHPESILTPLGINILKNFVNL